MSDFFKFENKECDIPFYNGKPLLSKFDWLLLILGLILFEIPIIFPINMGSTVFSVYLCAVLLLPVLYVSHGKYDLFFKKLKLGDLKTIILTFICAYVYSMTILFILQKIGIASSHISKPGMHVSAINVFNMIVQLMGEELFKITILIIVMFLIYHFTKNRKLSLIVSLFVTLIIFGMCHYGVYGGILQVILIQGLGSIFDIYAYIKTRNIFVSYIMHLLFDFVPYILEIILILMGVNINF